MQWLKRRWKGMMNRCYYQKDISYPRHGGSGIEVCDEWHGFNTFSQWCQSQPGFCRESQIDRIDNDGSYSLWTYSRRRRRSWKSRSAMGCRKQSTAVFRWHELENHDWRHSLVAFSST